MRGGGCPVKRARGAISASLMESVIDGSAGFSGAKAVLIVIRRPIDWALALVHKFELINVLL